MTPFTPIPLRKWLLSLSLAFIAVNAHAGESERSSVSRQSIPAESTSSSVSRSASPLDSLKILGVEPQQDTAVNRQFLQPDEAFQLNTEIQNKNSVVIRWRIADTYYLYRDKFRFKLLDSPDIHLEGVSLPPGKIKTDPYFGRVEVYFETARALVKLTRSNSKSTELKLEVGYQGCTELGLCYPPITRSVALTLPPALD